MVHSRQGFGWFVASVPLRQALGALGTIEAQLAASGRRAERRVLSFAYVAPPPWVARTLEVEEVLEVRRLNLADDAPFARVTVWCPERLARRLSRQDVESASFYELLGLDLGGATQTIGAAGAAPDDARVLEVPVGSPVLVCQRVTRTTGGQPVLVSEHVFPAHLTEFSVDLPQATATLTPDGLRLVR